MKKKKVAEKGDKIKMKKCPRCNDELIIKNEDGVEVLKCESCKFKVKNG